MGRHGGHPSLKRTLTLEGCGPSQPRNPIKANIGRCLVAAKRSFQHWVHALLQQNEVPVVQLGAEERAPSRSRSKFQ